MYLPAEVCIVVPGQASNAKLSAQQTQQMILHAVRKPWENAASIVNQGIHTVGLDEKSNILMVRLFASRMFTGYILICCCSVLLASQ